MGKKLSKSEKSEFWANMVIYFVIDFAAQTTAFDFVTGHSGD